MDYNTLIPFKNYAELYHWATALNAGPVSAWIAGALHPQQFTLTRATFAERVAWHIW